MFAWLLDLDLDPASFGHVSRGVESLFQYMLQGPERRCTGSWFELSWPHLMRAQHTSVEGSREVDDSSAHAMRPTRSKKAAPRVPMRKEPSSGEVAVGGGVE